MGTHFWKIFQPLGHFLAARYHTGRNITRCSSDESFTTLRGRRVWVGPHPEEHAVRRTLIGLLVSLLIATSAIVITRGDNVASAEQHCLAQVLGQKADGELVL